MKRDNAIMEKPNVISVPHVRSCQRWRCETPTRLRFIAAGMPRPEIATATGKYPGSSRVREMRDLERGEAGTGALRVMQDMMPEVAVDNF